ncbi:MAG: hypothetical protein ACO2PP_14560 [Thermocrinis sp.]
MREGKGYLWGMLCSGKDCLTSPFLGVPSSGLAEPFGMLLEIEL